jgi:prepilin-type N-terminal cleavage/methylation domain-containing protein
MRFARTRRLGFTLVELLVVIGIIALLIAILLPSLARARAQANAVKCAAQMRDIGNQLMIYATANKGVVHPVNWHNSQPSYKYIHLGGAVPPEDRWPMLVFVPPPSAPNYTHPLMICPSDQEPRGDHSYNLNSAFFPYQGSQDVSHKAIRLGNKVKYYTPSEVVLLVDKWPQQSEWHLDVECSNWNTYTWNAAFCEDQWDRLVFNIANKNTDKAQYKHGKSGNNFLRFDFSVSNEEPNEPRQNPGGGRKTGRYLAEMASPHTYLKQ